MSDMFDHELDAWESYDLECELGFGGDYSDNYFVKNRGSNKSREVHYDKIKVETDKAYLFWVDVSGWDDEVAAHEFWVPKRLCKRFNKANNIVHIYTPFLAKKARELGLLCEYFEEFEDMYLKLTRG